MFHPLPLFIGLRYVRARTHRFFVSFITWAALVGVGVGMAALIVILSVMNGFEDELRDRLVSLSAHARVVAHEEGGQSSTNGPTEAEWASAENAVRSVKGVVGVAPYVELQGLAVRTPEMQPVVLRGVDPKAEMTVSDLAHSLVRGRFSDLVAGTGRVIVGSVVAERLGVGVNDTLNVLIPTVSEGAAPSSKLREFSVAGIFEVGQVEADSSLVYANLQDVGALDPGSANGRGLRVRFDDPLHAPQITPQLRRLLPKTFDVFDWTQDNASYFRAISIEKTMMALILLLIVAVAAFNIVAMLVMVVTDKRTDIAILRTLGASPRRVMGVFMTQGLVIGWVGVALGLVLGLALAYNVDTIVPFLERALHFQIMDSDVFYDSSIPSHVRWENVVTIAVASLALTGLATIYPAIRAARTAPAEALRYE
jgi:lipoprotein-releasing system permease protein